MVGIGDSEDKSTSTHVIREVYEGDETDTFENELEKALEAKAKYIIIEPQRLGDETARWIRVGNCLHKTAVASGLVSIVCGAIFPDRPLLTTPFCAVTIFCTGLYTVSWNVDHCCQYQVETDPKKLEKIPDFHNYSSSVVLVYSKNTRTKYLQRSVALIATAFCAWRLYESFK